MLFSGKMLSPRRRQSSGFTLAELLVVIGIIAVLISILLPALASARKSARQIQCASALRQLGCAFLMYVTDNQGYLPPWRVGNVAESPSQAGGEYQLNDILFGDPTVVPNVSVNEAAYWMDFITPYISRSDGGSGDTTTAEMNITNNSIVWGCPEWTGYLETDKSIPSYGQMNRQRPGYSYNYMPMFEPGYPDPSMASYPNTPEKCDIRSTNNFVTWVGPDANTRPVWYKLSQVDHNSERALLGDSVDYALEARAWNGQGATPQLKLHYDDVMYARYEGSSTIIPATTFDYYRHGTPPSIQYDGTHGYYYSTGGKIAFNILYFDGHVAEVNDRREAYHSLRMETPDPTTD